MAVKTVLLVGAPNSGKTTLFNQLTGQSLKIVNYPGSTVDVSVGKWVIDDQLLFLDTPGIYSLHATSDDERITLNTLTNLSNVIDSGYDKVSGLGDFLQSNCLPTGDRRLT